MATNRLLLWLVIALFFVTLVRFVFDIKTDARFEDLLSFFEDFKMDSDIASWFNTLHIPDIEGLPEYLEWLNFFPRLLNFVIQSTGMILNLLVTVVKFVYAILQYVFAGTV